MTPRSHGVGTTNTYRCPLTGQQPCLALMWTEADTLSRGTDSASVHACPECHPVSFPRAARPKRPENHLLFTGNSWTSRDPGSSSVLLTYFAGATLQDD
jgi:hypothetical protein